MSKRNVFSPACAFLKTGEISPVVQLSLHNSIRSIFWTYLFLALCHVDKALRFERAFTEIGETALQPPSDDLQSNYGLTMGMYLRNSFLLTNPLYSNTS